jgi:hypothetical protein
VGKYILEKKPDVIVHLGDHWDMPSLSSYDKGKKRDFCTRRTLKDIEVGNQGMDLLLAPMREYNEIRRRRKERLYKPRMVFCKGNHEHRIDRAVDEEPELLEGLLGHHLLDLEDWETHEFLEVIEIDGIHYSHYFYNPMTGRPWGGQMHTRLKNVGFSFTMGHQQGKDQAERYLSDGSVLRGLVVGSCLTPDHRVLTADLRYVPLGEISPGDEIVSFDEFPERHRYRTYRTGFVQRTKLDKAPCFEVALASGKVFKATEDHQWLTRVGGQTSVKNRSTYMWRPTSKLRKGSVVPRIFDEWETLDSYDAGWLSGIYDGEGSLYTRRVSNGRGVVMQLSVSQKPGLVLDKIHSVLNELVGLDSLNYQNSRGVVGLRVKGGARSCAKLLGSLRPVRLLDKFKPELLGSLSCSPARDNDKIVSIKPIGEQEIVRIEVDRGTMVVEGYPHHNCYLHDEDYKGPQGNEHWRGIIVKHEVKDGNYDLLEVGLPYLKRRYG